MSTQPIRSYRPRRAVRCALAPLALGMLLATAAAAQEQQPESYDTAEQTAPPAATADEAQPQPTAGSYGYLRLVEGSATIVPASSGTR